MIKKPLILEISDGVYAINEFGLDTMFIVIGDNKALVIDTGMGCFDFKSLIEEITTLPYIVVLTHGHLDHAGGVDQFKEVYVHPLDRDQVLSIKREDRMKSCKRMRGLEGDIDVWDYKDSDARSWNSLPKFIDLNDGMEFDLGGRIVKTIFTPGHSKGSCSFIDSKSRILFSGDACNMNLMVTDCLIKIQYETMLRLKSHENEFDRNYNGHLGFSSGLTHIPVPKDVIDDGIVACKRIMDSIAVPSSNSLSPRYPNETVSTYLYGTISITYRKNHILD